MSLKKLSLLFLAFIVTVSIWIIFYLRDIHQPQRQEEASVKTWGINREQLKSIDEVYKHIWDDTTWVVQGENLDNEQVYLFERDQTILAQVKASDVLSKDQLKDAFKQSKPSADILRITPGIYNNNTPIWEIYYKMNDGNGNHACYDFYSFDLQGRLLETYKLPASG